MKATELGYFIEVSKCLSLTRASERLGISQPSLSLSMKRLEKDLGVLLLNRFKTGVRLTLAGERLLQKSTFLLDAWNDVKKSVYDANHAIEGHIIFGCHSVVAMHHLSDGFASLLAEHKKLSISFKHGLSREINEAIVCGKVDIGLVVNPIKHPELVIVQLKKDRIGFWHHKENEGVDKKNITLLCDPQLSQTSVLIKKYQRKGGIFTRTIECSTLELLAKFARQKVGVAILPESIAASSVNHQLQQIEPSLYYQDDICLVYRAENRWVKAISAISEALR